MEDPEAFPFTTPSGSDAKIFIQWKGTTLCMDFHCPCGKDSHIDSDFTYYVKCPYCESVFEMGTQVIVKRVAEDPGLAKLMEPGFDDPLPERLTPQEWCDKLDARIMDPDGWRDPGDDWNKPIDLEEFTRRFNMCTVATCGWPDFYKLPSR